MKKVFYLTYILLLAIACITHKPESEDARFMNQAVVKARNSNKLLIIEFWSVDCGSSLSLNRDVFKSNAESSFLDKNFVLVRVSHSDSIYKSLWNRFKLDHQCSVIIFDKNGNEIERTVSYDGNKENYVNFLKDVSEGKNLYSFVCSAYASDSMNVRNNFLMAKKMLFRNQPKEAMQHFYKVLQLDPRDKYGFNQECRSDIANSSILISSLDAYKNVTGINR